MEVRFDHVSFSYGQAAVLHDVSLTLDRPGLVCIIGPNGVGKSTLVKCMNKLLRPQSGNITIDGKDLSKMDLREVAEHVSYVPPATSDCFSMPVMDAVLLGRSNKRKWKTTEEDIEVVNRTLKMLEMQDYSMRRFNELSAGQHQRVALARGLVQDTGIMILDEPTSNLDVKHQVYVMQLLKAVAQKKGKLIIMICHDLNIAARYSDQLIVMAPPGVVDSVGSPREVITPAMIRRIYGIDCMVLELQGAPHVVLKDTFAED